MKILESLSIPHLWTGLPGSWVCEGLLRHILTQQKLQKDVRSPSRPHEIHIVGEVCVGTLARALGIRILGSSHHFAKALLVSRIQKCHPTL